MKIYIVLFVLSITSVFSQKQYKFDYALEYELNFFKDATNDNRVSRKKIKTYYLINSKNNNYVAQLVIKDSLNYTLLLRDNNGIFAEFILKKEKVNKAEFIHIDCQYVNRYHTKPRRPEKYYDFFVLKDTVINE